MRISINSNKYTTTSVYLVNSTAKDRAQSYDVSAAACVQWTRQPCGRSTPLCTVIFVKSFARWQYRFDVDSNFLSYLVPLSVVQFHPECNQLIHLLVVVIPPHISSKSVQNSCEARKCRCWQGTSGHNSLRSHSFANASNQLIYRMFQKKSSPLKHFEIFSLLLSLFA